MNGPVGFSGHGRLLLAGEKIEFTPALVEEYVKCKTDIIYFAEKYCYIVVPGKGKQIIKLRDYQKKQLKIYCETPNGKKHVVVLSSRQSGKTTTSGIYLLHKAIFWNDRTVAILANKERTAIEIMKRIKVMYERMPEFLQQGIMGGGWNKKTIQFENGSTIIAASTSSSAIRGYTVTDLLLDEYAFVPGNIQEEFMASVYPTIIAGEDSKIIVISTPNGLESFFEIWTDAIRDRNQYSPIKIDWWEVPGRDETWKKNVIKDIGISRFECEFNNKFLGSSSTLIDGEVLEQLVFQEPTDFKYNGSLSIYEQPIPRVNYIAGVDTGAGIGKDSSTISIFKVLGLDELIQVAMYRNNKIRPHDFAGVVNDIGHFYNDAHVLAENNGKAGGMMIEQLWHHKEYEKLVNPKKNDLGISSNVKTKYTANTTMKRYIENGYVKLNDKRTIFELSRYEEIKPNIYGNANSEDHDDCVLALAWAVYFAELSEFMDFDIPFDPITNKIVDPDKVKIANMSNFDMAHVGYGDDEDDKFSYLDEDGSLWESSEFTGMFR